MKINKLEIENVKRVKAVKIEPASSGLTVIGGRNNQGKTSVLDSIAWALGGDRYRPSQAAREGSVIPPHLHIVMNNGLEVERKGKNSDLKVTDPTGKRAGQQLLNEFVEELAINLPKFMASSSREKAEVLLKIIGVGRQLHELEAQETDLYNRRRAIGQIADQKAKFAREMTYYPDAPKEPVSASELIRQQQDILARNGENQRKRAQASALSAERDRLAEKVNTLKDELMQYECKLAQAEHDMIIARQTAETLHDESTTELEQNIRDIERINVMVRANLDKDKAEMDALAYRNEYDSMTAELNDVRQKKIDLLQNASLPLPGLSVSDGELTYNGKKWDSMSGSDQLKVSTAIVRKLNPNCGFVLLDKLEQMDLDTLREFGAWLEQEGLQAIATRVSTGGECQIIIEDGYVKGDEPQPKEWKAGEF
ncbi:MAG: AAA family ATPase [Oscillospiraceae bacterium]|nr:AAA family ATPase [Oscillospiraceae bacterium]